MSPSTKTSGCPGIVRSGPTLTRPTESTGAPSVRPTSEARTPAAHSTVDACDVLVADTHTIRRDIRDAGIRPDLHAERFEIAHRAGRELRVERGQDARTGFDQNHARLPRIDAAEIPGERVAAHLADRTRQFHAGRSAADDDEREMTPPRVDVLIALRRFERLEHAPSDLGGLRQRLQARRVRPPIPRVRSTRAASRKREAGSRT